MMVVRLAGVVVAAAAHQRPVLTAIITQSLVLAVMVPSLISRVLCFITRLVVAVADEGIPEVKAVMLAAIMLAERAAIDMDMLQVVWMAVVVAAVVMDMMIIIVTLFLARVAMVS